jgi:hypothetical protein
MPYVPPFHADCEGVPAGAIPRSWAKTPLRAVLRRGRGMGEAGEITPSSGLDRVSAQRET